jgi:hypothetical protein
VSPSYLASLPILEEAYELTSELARDGLGSLWEARERGTSRTISIRLFEEVQTDTPEAQVLLEEAAAINVLHHPHIVEISGQGRTRQGCGYIAMERLSRKTLASLIEQSGPLPQLQVVAIGIQLLEALCAIHELGFSHRDLNPRNIALVQRDGEPDCVKLCGFGFLGRFSIRASDLPAQLVTNRYVAVSGQSEVFGTPEYTHSDQALGGPIDVSANLYSVGVILYQAVAGRLPFSANSAPDLVRMHHSSEPMRPSLVRPELGISQPLEDLILRALSKRPADRPASARAFLAQLVAIHRDLEHQASAPTVHSGSIASYASPIAHAGRQHDTRWRPLAVAVSKYLGAFCCMYIVGAGLGHVFRGSQRRTLTPSAVPSIRLEISRPSAPTPSARRAALLPASASPAAATTPLEVAADGHPVLPAARTHERSRGQGESAAAAGASRRTSKMIASADATVQPTSTRNANDILPSTSDSAPIQPEQSELQHAQGLLARNLVAEACAEGRRAAEHSPNSPAVWDFLGRCLMRLGHPDEARACYRRYLALAPNSANAPFVRAIVEGGQH